MSNRNKKHNLTDEEVALLHDVFYDDLEQDIEERLIAKVKEIVVDFVGSILDFPLTVRQTARLTGRTEENIYKMCQRGVIPFSKVGGQVHINLRDIKSALILDNEQEEALTT